MKTPMPIRVGRPVARAMRRAIRLATASGITWLAPRPFLRPGALLPSLAAAGWVAPGLAAPDLGAARPDEEPGSTFFGEPFGTKGRRSRGGAMA